MKRMMWAGVTGTISFTFVFFFYSRDYVCSTPLYSFRSTLVYVRALNTFFYYDSLNEYNLAVAQRTAGKFMEVLGLNGISFLFSFVLWFGVTFVVEYLIKYNFRF